MAQKSKSLVVACACVLVSAALGGCGGDTAGEADASNLFSGFDSLGGGGIDAGSSKDSAIGDTTLTDAKSDVADVKSDVADAKGDVADAKSDVKTDAKSDAKSDAKTDVKADTAPAPDTCGTGTSIADLLDCTEGTIDFQLENALVTYVGPQSLLLYDGSTTRGMMVSVGDNWPINPKPMVGEQLSLHVTSYGNVKGQQQVLASDGWITGGLGDAQGTALDLASIGADLFSENYESRLVIGKGLKVKSFSGQEGVIATPNAGNVVLRVDGKPGLCAGAIFDLKAGALTQSDTTFGVQVLDSQSDLVNIDITPCKPPGDDDSNWGFEEDLQDDPPADFFKVGTAMTANRVVNYQHSGQACCRLTWTSQDNQDLFGGLFVPVSAGQQVKFSVWWYDNDPSGKGRPALVFYKSDKTAVVSTHYSSTYSSDSPDWQQQTYTFTAPPDSVYVRGFVRMYDNAASWSGKATVYIDDWSLTVQ